MKLMNENFSIVSTYKLESRTRYILDKMAAQTKKGQVQPIINAAILHFAEANDIPFVEDEYKLWFATYSKGDNATLIANRKAGKPVQRIVRRLSEM